MNNNENIHVVRIGGEPVSTIKIKKNEIFEYKFRYDNFNILKLSLFFQEEYKYKNNPIKVEIYETKYNSLVAEQILVTAEKGWNDFEFHNTKGVYQEELILKIIEKEQDEVLIGCDNKDCICCKLYYEEKDNELQCQIDEMTKEIRKIYNSTGWKLLVKTYRIRDIITAIPRIIKKIGKGISKLFKNMNKDNFVRAHGYIKQNGFKEFMSKLYLKLTSGKISYEAWLKTHSVTEEELQNQKAFEFEYKPLISILVPTYKTPKHLLTETINSVINQSYSNWELCIADGASNLGYIKEILDDYASKDKRIKVKYLDENKGIAGNTQECYYMATGDYIGLFDHDDLLEPNALFEVVKAVNEDRTIDFIYTDEDKINEKGTRRFDPHFKQDFAIDTLRSYNYICHFSVFKKELMDKIGGFRDGFNGSQDYDIILRATYNAKNIHHIPKILYSWRVHSGSTAGNPKNKMYCYESAKKAIAEDLKVRGIKGTVKDGKYIGTYEVDYEIIGNPKVSILIPSKDHIEDLDRAIRSILTKTDYTNYEIIIIENNSELKETFKYYEDIQRKYSNIKVVVWKGIFNYSAINNFGAKYAEGEYILLLNNDVEVISTNWLTKMLGLAQREDVGCVGAKLYYPDSTIQHGGVIVGLGGGAAHAHRGFSKKAYGYFMRLGLTHNLSAVTGACLLVKKSVFDEVNGLDESFVVAYNDVDFCLRVLKTGRVNVWTPYAELYHYESKSRGDDSKDPEKAERFRGEFNRFREIYADFLEKGDPYYNVNLTLSAEDFSLRNDI